MKSLNFILGLEIYPFDIMFSFGETDEQMAAHIKRLLPGFDNGAPWEFPASNSSSNQGRTIMFESGQVVVRLKVVPEDCSHYGTLAHEIFHAVEFVLERAGIKHCGETSEAYAYLIGFVTKKVLYNIAKHVE